ncbi:MAG: RagB/SusD family nutrient uptake outer membrane protein [Dysgonamonadaceae bacterium]|jgi:hypothetical protein|nr:RagB/SusD family nutrient uptake outer membrane protein [Dysgonamonadaceae bacterium]
MKKFLKITLIAMFIGFPSCSDLLEKQPIDIISDAVVWDDTRLVEAYLDQIFSEMLFMFSESPWEDGIGSHLWGIHDKICMSDEARHAFPWYPVYATWGRGLLNVGGGFDEYWLYPTIRSCNEMLEKMETSAIDDANKKRLIATARWARAMCYFAMVKRYGGIPLITVVQKIDALPEDLFLPRNREVDVYDFIINEMDFIFEDLEPAAAGGYPTKWAALALKSRAALYAASIATWGTVQLDGITGIPATEKNRFWTACYEASDMLIHNSGHSLYNKYPEDKIMNFRQLFVDENSNPESIYAFQFTGQDAVGFNHGWDMFTSPQGFTAWAGGSCAVYLDMVEEFENADGSPGTFDEDKYTAGLWDADELFAHKEPRFFASIYTQNTPFQGKTVDYYTSLILPDNSVIREGFYEGVRAQGLGNYDGGAVSGFGILKYVDESKINPGNWSSDTDWMVFRLGEIYLNMAEACVELGRDGEALNLLNTIRERAGVAQLTSVDREKVRHERKIELAFESHRWYDLRRWRIATTELSKPFKGLVYSLDYNSTNSGGPWKFKISVTPNVDGDNEKRFFERHYYLPISSWRTSNNPKLVENPGYSQ